MFLTSGVVDELAKSTTPTVPETYVHEENIIDNQDALVESSTLIHDDLDVTEDDSCNYKHILVESNMPVQFAGYSLVIPVITDKIEDGTVDTSIVTFNKPSEYSRVDCSYVVAANFFFLVIQ